jgi:hypothetical protein
MSKLRWALVVLHVAAAAVLLLLVEASVSSATSSGRPALLLIRLFLVLRGMSAHQRNRPDQQSSKSASQDISKSANQ